jgi:hypothetical protein
MKYFTTNTYEVKRKINIFTKKLTKGVGNTKIKFVEDMVFGIIKAKSILLSSIADSLIEPIKKANTIKRLSNNLMKVSDEKIQSNYNNEVIKTLGKAPVIIVDDSDVIKPYGKEFESLGIVRDGSSPKKVLEKGYMVTEMVGLTENKRQPISLFSHIHSSTEKEYKSTNDITFSGINQIADLLDDRATFVFDRGYDMNALFNHMHEIDQDFIVRLTKKRKLLFKGKWFKATTLLFSRKGKIKTTVRFQNEMKDCYISYLNVRITGSKRNIKLILVYGLGETPMMLATNKPIQNKDDAIAILRTYLSRWRVEEYFRFKKQVFNFEDYRVRSLTSMNNLNAMLTYALGFMAIFTEKHNQTQMFNNVICNANPLREKVLFYGYQIAKGLAGILAFARTGIAEWRCIRHVKKTEQLVFPLLC